MADKEYIRVGAVSVDADDPATPAAPRLGRTQSRIYRQPPNRPNRLPSFHPSPGNEGTR